MQEQPRKNVSASLPPARATLHMQFLAVQTASAAPRRIMPCELSKRKQGRSGSSPQSTSPAAQEHKKYSDHVCVCCCVQQEAGEGHCKHDAQGGSGDIECRCTGAQGGAVFAQALQQNVNALEVF